MPEREMKILVCNAGSSSLKFSLFEAEGELLLAEGGIDWTTKPTRLVFRRTGQQEVLEELKLQKHSDAAARILNDLQAGRVVERRQLCQFPDRPLDLWRDPHRGGVTLAAVNDAMSNGLELAEYAQRRRRASS